jgi:hypothetical protein
MTTKPKKVKKTKAKKPNKRASNSNVNKINININSGSSKSKGGSRSKKNKNAVSDGSTGSGKGGNGKNAVSGVSTGGLNGVDNQAGRLGNIGGGKSINDNNELVATVKGLVEDTKKLNSRLVGDSNNNSNNLLMDRLDRIEEDSLQTKQLIDDGYSMVKSYYKQPKQNDYVVSEVPKPTINNQTTLPIIQTPVKQKKMNVTSGYQSVSKGQNKYRVSVKNGKTKIEKYNAKTNIWTSSNATSLSKDTGTTKTSLTLIKKNLMGNENIPIESNENVPMDDIENVPMVEPNKEVLQTPTVIPNPLTTPKKAKPKQPNANELIPKELKQSAQKVVNPFENIQDDGDVSDFDYGAFENVTIRQKPKTQKHSTNSKVHVASPPPFNFNDDGDDRNDYDSESDVQF